VVGSDEAFYSCADVDFGGGTTPSPTTSPTTPPPTTTTTTAPADTTAPDTSVTGLSGSRRGISCSGSATDNRGVTGVRVGIRNQASGQWWHSDGTWGAFQSYPATLGSPGARSTSWTFSWVPPTTGNFGINAVARDAAGNIDGSPAWRTFTVGKSTAALT